MANVRLKAGFQLSLALFVLLVGAALFFCTQAHADEEGGESESAYFTLKAESVDVDTGTFINLSNCITRIKTTDDTLYPTGHFDYIVSDEALLAGSKHYSLKKAAMLDEPASTTVEIRYLSGTQYSCSEENVLQTATLTVNIVNAPATPVESGLQGSDIKMSISNQEVVSSVLCGQTYYNVLKPVENQQTLKLTIAQNTGVAQILNNYEDWGFRTSEEAYRSIVGSHMTVVYPSGSSETVSSYIGTVSFTNVTTSGTTMLLPLGTYTGSVYVLVSGSLHTYLNGDRSIPDRYLGSDIIYEIPVVESTYQRPDPLQLAGASINLEYRTTTYNGSYKTPEVYSLRLADGTVVYDGFFVSYKNNVLPGKGTVVVTGDNWNCAGVASTTFAISKSKCHMYAKVSKSKFKYSKKKSRATKISVYGATGKVTFKSNKKLVTVSKSGKVTIKKKFKGTAYITVKDAGSSRYLGGTYKIKIVVKK